MDPDQTVTLLVIRGFKTVSIQEMVMTLPQKASFNNSITLAYPNRTIKINKLLYKCFFYENLLRYKLLYACYESFNCLTTCTKIIKHVQPALRAKIRKFNRGII
jgi:hypothetical protein